MPSRRTYAHSHQQRLTDQARMMQVRSFNIFYHTTHNYNIDFNFKENLLNDAAYRRNTRSRSADTQSNQGVYRLESIPTYNPEILNNPDYKIDMPPPTYEQAITRCPTLVPNPNTILPDYSPPRSNMPRQNSQSNGNG